jgi:lysophospholipase L1-like esterase
MKKLGLLLLFISLNTFSQKTTIYSIGDSTMATKVNPATNPEFGWCQVLPTFFKPDVVIDNRAVNGRSTKSFIAEKKWEAVYKVLKPGDYVFIQFGHNDGKVTDSLRYTNPHTAYRYNLIQFVKEAREKGAIPILFSPIARRNFNEQGVLISKHETYSMEMRLVAQEFNVPFIDMEYLTESLEIAYGPEKSKQLHLHFKPGEVSYYPEGKDDDTHLSIKGATEIAKIAVAQLKLLTNPQFQNLIKAIK